MPDEMAQDFLRIERKESDMKGCFELIEREGWGIPLPVGDDKIFLVVPYVSPYGTFSGIKEIQEALRKADPFNRRKLTLCLDISEWATHQDEAYFQRLLMYLHDRREEMDYVFLMENAKGLETRQMYLALRRYMPGTFHRQESLDSEEKLEKELLLHSFDKGSASFMAKAMMNNAYRDYRTYAFVDQLSQDIRECIGKNLIDVAGLKKYLMDKDNLLSLVGKGIAR